MTDIKNFFLKNRLCPTCAVKRIINGVKLNNQVREDYDSGTALTPPMGWASWNKFGRNINEKVILATAEAMETLGLRDYGYTYLNVDDCWMSSVRDKNGRLQGDLSAFPSGIKSLVEKVNERGFKMGIYTSNGAFTCEDLPSSLHHERIDAETFAEWGVEYFKYDFCHNEAIPTRAPEIRSLGIARPGEEDLITLDCEKAELRGSAQVLFDRNLSGDGKYVGGLDADMGKIVFYDVEIPETGEYTLTLSIRKFGNCKKYAEITVNGEKSYSVWAPPTSSRSKDGRVQVSVHLEKGNNNLLIQNPIGSRMDSASKQYRNMGYELQRAARLQAEKEGREIKPICYSICEWGLNRPYLWGRTAGNLWRTTPDIRPNWTSIIAIYEHNVKLYAHAGVGHYNDPDMLEVGNGKLTNDENRAHFSLWCMMASPLILGNDLRDFLRPDGSIDETNETFRTVTNREAIAIDQDPLCIPCRRISKPGLVDVLVKPLENNEIAVCILNKGPGSANGSFDLNEIAQMDFVRLTKSGKYAVRDIWNETDFTSNGKISEKLDGHSVLLYRVKAE